MVSIRKKGQSNRKLYGQLDDFDKDIIIGNAVHDRQQIVIVNEGTVDQEFTVNNTGSNSTLKENLVNMKTLERCFNERIDREMSKFVDIVEDRIQF